MTRFFRQLARIISAQSKTPLERYELLCLKEAKQGSLTPAEDRWMQTFRQSMGPSFAGETRMEQIRHAKTELIGRLGHGTANIRDVVRLQRLIDESDARMTRAVSTADSGRRDAHPNRVTPEEFDKRLAGLRANLFSSGNDLT